MKQSEWRDLEKRLKGNRKAETSNWLSMSPVCRGGHRQDRNSCLYLNSPEAWLPGEGKPEHPGEESSVQARTLLVRLGEASRTAVMESSLRAQMSPHQGNSHPLILIAILGKLREESEGVKKREREKIIEEIL